MTEHNEKRYWVTVGLKHPIWDGESHSDEINPWHEDYPGTLDEHGVRVIKDLLKSEDGYVQIPTGSVAAVIIPKDNIAGVNVSEYRNGDES